MNSFNDLLNTDFLGMQNWKWFTLTLVAIGLYFFRTLVVWICLKAKKAQEHLEEKSFFQFFLEQRIEKPVSWVIISSIAFIVVEYLALPDSLSKYILIFVKLLLTINVIRICYMASEAFGYSLEEWSLHTDNQFDDQLAPFASRTLKVLVIIIGALVGLQNFGVNVTALLAGLGIGGVALAFAAQDTVANVFGTITIILDRPFKLGDYIKVGDTEGNVHEVGFRSTRIKTFYNSIVTIPNSVVAKEKIDNMSERHGWVRFRHTIGFTYEAKIEQINAFCESLRSSLMQDNSVDHERVSVFFNNFGDSSLNVLINFHFFVTPQESEFQKSNLYLNLIAQISEQQKLSFAFPTRTVYTKQIMDI